MNDPQPRHIASEYRSRHGDIATLLRDHHAQCELNFLQLQRLLPEFRAGARLQVACGTDDRSLQRIRFCALERSRYTALVSVTQESSLWGARCIELHVRVYLDVSMAEVVASPPAVKRLLARYPYPNPRMLARDEKWQLNRLLGEWLSCCLRIGYAMDSAVFVADI
jgi:uncharacterized protein